MKLPASVKVSAVFATVLLFSDPAVFHAALFILPDYTGTEEMQHYSFLHRYVREIHNSEKRRIWIAGSSVALYGADPELIGKKLNKKKSEYPFLFSHQGMNAVHLTAWSGPVISARPSLFVLIVNPVDLRIERYAVKEKSVCDPQASFAAMKEDLIRLENYEELYPAGMLREFGFAGTYGNYYNAEENVSLVLGSVFEFAGRRRMIQDAVSQYAGAVFRKGRFYHDYQGETWGGQITRRGYSGREVRIKVSSVLRQTGLSFRYEAGQDDSSYLNVSTVTGEAGREKKHKDIRLTGHWQTLPLSDFQEGEIIQLRFPAERYFPEYDDYLSARFLRFTGREISLLQSSEECCSRISREDNRYYHMSDEEYAASYEKRLRSYGKPETEYLRLLEESKRKLSQCSSFSGSLPALFFLKEFSKRLRAERIRLIIINSPENKITKKLYGDSVWYSGYLEFLKKVSDEFYDASDLLTMQEFYDSHHPSWYGRRRFSGFIGEILVKYYK